MVRIITFKGVTTNSQSMTYECKNATCDTCTATTTSTCATCQKDLMTILTNSTNFPLCQKECPERQFANSWSVCQPCDSSCYNCSNSTYFNCTSCNEGEFLFDGTQNSSFCTTTCSRDKYADTTTSRCLPCDETCVTCKAGGQDQCYTCNNATNSLYLQYLPGPSACNPTCPNGSYPDPLELVCLPCDYSCKNCLTNGSMNCLSCNNLTYLQNLVGPSSCKDLCPNSSTYPDNLTNVCESCDISCKTCKDKGISNCMSCKSLTYLQNLTGPSSCLDTCPQGTYRDNFTNICELCIPPCKNCTYNGTFNCTSCIDFTYLQPNTGQTSCNNSCPSNYYYAENTTFTCEKCDESCWECTTASSLNCTKCQFNNINDTYLQLEIGPISCNFNCSPERFKNFYNHSCTVSDECPDNLYSIEIEPEMYNCLSDCPFNYFESNRNGIKVCRQCDQSCSGCIDFSSQCIDCQTNYVPKQFTINYPVCFCNDSSKCNLTCPFNLYFHDNNCVLQCPDGSYTDEHDPYNYSCVPCDPQCQTCVGPSNTSCTSCNSTLHLNFYPINQTNYGLCNCSNGYFESEENCIRKLVFI